MDYRTVSIDEVFIKVKNLSETMHSELWDGRLRESEERGLLLKTISPLEKESEGEGLFKIALERYITLHSESYLASGIDSLGFGYLIIKFVENNPLREIGMEFSARERLGSLILFLQFVRDFHTEGIACGDISLESFRTTPTSIMFLGFLGACFEEIKSQPSSQNNFNKYLAPEVAMGGSVSIASDVYAIGVLGYIVCCGAKSISENMARGGHFLRSHLAPSKVDATISIWVDDVLGNCLQFDPIKRTKDSWVVLSQVESSLRGLPLDIPRIQWLTHDLIVQPQQSQKQNSNDSESKSAFGQSERTNARSQKKDKSKSGKGRKIKLSGKAIKIALAIFGIGLFVSIVGLLMNSKMPESSPKGISDHFLKIESIIGQEKLNTSLEKFLAEEQPPVDKLKNLEAILKKNIKIDQALFGYIDANLTPLSEEYSTAIKETLVFWLDKYGYQKIKVEIEKQIAEGGFERTSSNLAGLGKLILISIDPTASNEERVASLRLIYQKFESFSFVFAALLAEESSQAIFLPVLKEFLSGRGFSNLPKDASNRAIYLLAEETRSLLGDDTNKLLEESSNEDLKVVADALLSNSVKVELEFFKAALHAFTKGSDSGNFVNIFIELGQREAVLGNTESAVLYKLALGTAKSNDLSPFIEWNNQDWEKVMYATLATNKDPLVLDRAFEIISRRGPSNPVSKGLLEYLKHNFWAQKEKFAYSFGVFSLREIATSAELDLAFEKILLLSNSNLFTTLISTDDPYFIEQAAERIAPIAKMAEIIPLLSDRNPRVRIAGVKALAGKNDINTLQTILVNYRKETDPEVIKVYNEIHWVTKNRDLPKNRSNSPG